MRGIDKKISLLPLSISTRRGLSLCSTKASCCPVFALDPLPRLVNRRRRVFRKAFLQFVAVFHHRAFGLVETEFAQLAHHAFLVLAQIPGQGGSGDLAEPSYRNSACHPAPLSNLPARSSIRRLASSRPSSPSGVGRHRRGRSVAETRGQAGAWRSGWGGSCRAGFRTGFRPAPWGGRRSGCLWVLLCWLPSRRRTTR